MTDFRFSSREIDDHKADGADWSRWVRQREAEMVLSEFPGPFNDALEIGAGRGAQSEILSKRCAHLICTELSADAFGERLRGGGPANVEYRICDAHDLSQFRDGTFDLVWSSHVLEHIDDLPRCLGECRRVLAPGGVMIHSMPSRWWKAFNLGLHRSRSGTVPGRTA